MIELLAEMLILSEYRTPKTVVNNPSEFNIHRKVESKPKAINRPCLKINKKSLVLAAWTYKLVKINENWLLRILI